MKKSTLTIVFFLMILVSGMSQTQESDAFSDFSQDVDAPAFNKELIISIEGSSVAGYAFIANGEQLKETVIMTHGLPGNDNQFDIAQSLRRAGKNVIHFNYRGSWGSEGDFSYSNSLKDVSAILDYLSTPENSRKLRIDTNAFVILGRSYGGGIALIQGSKDKRVEKIVAISSMNAGSDSHSIQDSSKRSLWKEYLDKQVMLKMNSTKFLQDVADNRGDYDVVTYKDQLSEKKVLLIENTRRNETWIKLLANVDYKIIESDHGFISNRIELTNVLIDWLNNN